MPEETRQKLIAEYTEVNQNFRMLADIRFKLLALIPTLGGVAIFLLSRMQQSEPESGHGLLLLISGLGFLATLGVTFYDQRNSELYNALSGRAAKLEKELRLDGSQFANRPDRGRYLFTSIQLGHDTGLALIYGAVLGAWFYPLTSTLLGLTPLGADTRHVISLIVAVFMVAIFVLELFRLDGASIRNLFRLEWSKLRLWTEVFKPVFGSKNKLRVQRKLRPGEPDIQEEFLCFRGKAIDRYKDADSYSTLTLYDCPQGYRVYVKNGDGTASLEPSHYHNGKLDYFIYKDEEKLLEEYPKFKEAVSTPHCRDVD